MVGMKKGTFAPTVLWDAKRGTRCVVHGDDFMFMCWRSGLEEMVAHLRKHYEMKVRAKLGDDPGDDVEISIHARNVCDSKDSKGLDKPVVREPGEWADADL